MIAITRCRFVTLQKPSPRQASPTVTTLGMDMGITNTAVCVIEHKFGRPSVLLSRMVPTHLLIRDFEEDGAWHRILAFRDHVAYILDTYKPTLVAGELFFIRGFRTNDGTYINFMLGLIADLCAERNIGFIGVNAGTWKGHAWIKTILPSVELLYQQDRPNHLVDSLMLALYARRSSHPSTEHLLRTLVHSLPKPAEIRLRPKAKRKVRKKKPSSPSAR